MVYKMDIPGFKLGREFAAGKYWRGYHALNLGNHKTVNIQVFDSSLVANQAFSSQFRDVTSKLVGASFGIMAPIIQADISNQACYVVSKYFPSPQQLSAPPPALSRYQILQFALQLAQTLDQLHKAGLVHGGIELNSLYFKAPDQLMLRPLILQRVIPILRPMSLNSLEQAEKRYLAPEASEGLTPATDFYALGVLLYQLILGPLPVDTTDAKLPKEWSFAGENLDLEEFFRQLLAVDPGRRIQSFDHFTTALVRCGIDLLESAPAVSKTTYARHHEADNRETASRSLTKWIVLTAGLALIALAGKLILLPTFDEAQQQPEPGDAPEVVASADTTNAERKPVEQPPAATLAKKEPAETSPSVDNLYQQALMQMETNPEAALQNLKAVLEQIPDDIASLKLKHQIEKELAVSSLIKTAEQQLKELKLLQPIGDNAYESYQTLAEMLSSDDERVRSGFTHIAAAYHTLAENLFNEDLHDKALEKVDLGLSVMDDYSPLLKLRITINEQKNELQRKLNVAQLEKQSNREQQNMLKMQEQKREEQRQLEEQQKRDKQRQLEEQQKRDKQRQLEEQQTRDKQRQLEEQQKRDKQRQLEEQQKRDKLRQLEEQQTRDKQRQLEEQRLLEKKQAEVEMGQRQEEQAKKAAQQAKEQEIDPFKQAKIDALLISANDYLKNGRLTLKNVFAAHLNYDELYKLDSTNQRVILLKEVLINAYRLLADRQPSDKLYKSAINAIEQGDQMHPKDRKQLQIRSQLSFSTF